MFIKYSHVFLVIDKWGEATYELSLIIVSGYVYV